MKKILLVMLVYLISIQAQAFGPDKIIFLDSTYEIRSQYLSVAFNGWIYNAFNYHSYPSTGYRVSLSKDDGNTWQTIIDFSVPGASGWYPQIQDMIVTGTDTLNLHVILALMGNGNGGPTNIGVIRAYDGNAGMQVGNEVNVGDFMTYRITDIALSTDSKNPLNASSPYSVAIGYTVSDNSGVDSLNFFLSYDGGLNFIGPFPADTTSGGFGNLDLSYGTSQGGINGSFGIVAEKDGHLSVLFTNAGSPTTFTAPVLIDTINLYTASNCSLPVISMQNGAYTNSSGGFSTIILAEANNSNNASTDLVSFYLANTQNGGNWSLEVIDSTADFTEMPSLDFCNSVYYFIATYYNSSVNELPFINRSMDSTGLWVRNPDNYPDTLSFDNPNPVVCCREVVNTDFLFSWKQVEDTTGTISPLEAVKFDVIPLPLGISDPGTSNDKFTVYPNPSNGFFMIRFNKEIKNAGIEITDVTGRIIYTEVKKSLAAGIVHEIHLNPSMGIYYIRLTDGEYSFFQKIIVN